MINEYKLTQQVPKSYFNTMYCMNNRLFKQYMLLLAVNQMASGLFRMIAAGGRSMIIANTFAPFALLILMVMGGFLLARGTVV